MFLLQLRNELWKLFAKKRTYLGFAMVVPGEVFSVFDASQGWQAYAAAHLALVTKAITIAGLAFMFSCFNVKPAAATSSTGS